MHIYICLHTRIKIDIYIHIPTLIYRFISNNGNGSSSSSTRSHEGPGFGSALKKIKRTIGNDHRQDDNSTNNNNNNNDNSNNNNNKMMKNNENKRKKDFEMDQDSQSDASRWYIYIDRYV
jgi:hypothetical protein